MYAVVVLPDENPASVSTDFQTAKKLVCKVSFQ